MRNIQEFSMEEWVIDPQKPSGSPFYPGKVAKTRKTSPQPFFAAQTLLIITP
jgi:hypothetical protein